MGIDNLVSYLRLLLPVMSALPSETVYAIDVMLCSVFITPFMLLYTEQIYEEIINCKSTITHF